MRRLALLVAGAALAGCSTDHPCDPTVPNTICTIAGSTLDEGYTGDGGPATDAVLYITMDSTIAPNGDVWFIDFNNYVIRQIDDQGIITTVEGNGRLGDSPSSDNLTEIPALQASNNHSTGMIFADGYLYIAAWHESRVKRVDMSDMMMENYAGTGSRTFYTGDGGPAMMADVDLPSSFAFDPGGNVVLMDQGNQVIRRVDATTGNISTIAGQCIIEAADCTQFPPVACPNSGSGGPPTSDKSVCFDPSMSDATTECANACTGAFAGDGGPAQQARFNLPYGQASDPAGRIAYNNEGDLLISDTANNCIRKIDATTGIIATIAGQGGTPGAYSGDGGPATQAQINHPIDLAIAPDDTIYFTDTYNSCIRKIDPTGVISTVVGQCNPDPTAVGFSGDGGPPLEAQLYWPYGIDLEGSKLYISDSYNNRLRVVNLPD